MKLTREEILQVCLDVALEMGFIERRWFAQYKDWPKMWRTLDGAMDRAFVERLLTEARGESQ